MEYSQQGASSREAHDGCWRILALIYWLAYSLSSIVIIPFLLAAIVLLTSLILHSFANHDSLNPLDWKYSLWCCFLLHVHMWFWTSCFVAAVYLLCLLAQEETHSRRAQAVSSSTDRLMADAWKTLYWLLAFAIVALVMLAGWTHHLVLILLYPSFGSPSPLAVGAWTVTLAWFFSTLLLHLVFYTGVALCSVEICTKPSYAPTFGPQWWNELKERHFPSESSSVSSLENLSPSDIATTSTTSSDDGHDRI